MLTNSVFDAKLFSVTMNIDIRNNINGYADKITADSEETPEIIQRGTRRHANRGERRAATRKAKKRNLELATTRINKQVKNRKGTDYVTESKNNNMDRIAYRGKQYERPHNYLWLEEAAWDEYIAFSRHWSNWLNNEHPDGLEKY